MSTPQQIRDHRRFRLAGNDNETVVEGAARRIDPDEDDDDPTTPGMRRARRR